MVMASGMPRGRMCSTRDVAQHPGYDIFFHGVRDRVWPDRAEKRVRMFRDLRKRTWAQARANSKPKGFPGQQHAWVKMQKIRPVLKR